MYVIIVIHVCVLFIYLWVYLINKLINKAVCHDPTLWLVALDHVDSFQQTM